MLLNSNPDDRKLVFWPSLSIQRRLPLYISLLILCVIVTFTLTAYYGVKDVAMKIGKERVRSATMQVGNMLQNSINSSRSNIRTFVKKDSIVNFVAGKHEFKPGVLSSLHSLHRDSTWVSVQLLDHRKTFLASTKDSLFPHHLASHILDATDIDSGRIGNFILINDSLYYPVAISIKRSDSTIGYLLIWRALKTANISQILSLIGNNAELFVGNKDGSVWTNLMIKVPHVNVDTSIITGIYKYKNNSKEDVVASAMMIPFTNWVLLVEIPEKNIIATAHSFLYSSIGLGLIILIIGVLIAWIMSRNIIKPLRKLTKGAEGIGESNLIPYVQVKRRDELGNLASAFNKMALKVNHSQQSLEKQVSDRTRQLEEANKEMEAFTYSVSHDLRAPIRGIIGFATILEEEYVSKLDDEAKRLTSVIKKNGFKMGNLIDDLLKFSRLGKINIAKSRIDTNKLVQEIIENYPKNIDWKISELADSFGDINLLQQVWINLLGNAVKYSANVEYPSIEIGSYRENEEVVFFVIDNGAGFDARYSDKLFQVFQRLHSAKDFEGTGVGLAIVEKIITKHGGRVWAESEEFKGAKFYFSLPPY